VNNVYYFNCCQRLALPQAGNLMLCPPCSEAN